MSNKTRVLILMLMFAVGSFIGIQHIHDDYLFFIKIKPLQTIFWFLWTLIILNVGVLIFVFFFPRAPIVRANTSLFYCQSLIGMGVPVNFGLYFITKISETPSSFQFSFSDAGFSGFLTSLLGIGGTYLFQKEYARLASPENRRWSERTPVIR
jgi:hypothetical protein